MLTTTTATALSLIHILLEPQNLVPSFIGMDYAQVQNNREYTGMYLFLSLIHI